MRKIRDTFSCANKKLARARRLYGYLCAKRIESNPYLVWVFAIRAQKFGLYSQKTDIASIAFSLCRHAFRVSEYRDWGGFGWYEWQDACGVRSVLRDGVKMKNGKPHIRTKKAPLWG